MRMQPILLEDVQIQERVPGRRRLGESVGLAGERVQAITAHAVAPFDMHQRRLLDRRAEGGARLDPQQMASLIAVLDRLREVDPLGQAQWWASATPAGPG